MINQESWLETCRKLAMGVLDSSVRETNVDRHDHNSVIEGNIVRSGDNDSRFVLITIVVIICCLSVAYAVKASIDKCVQKLIKAMRREPVVTPQNNQ